MDTSQNKGSAEFLQRSGYLGLYLLEPQCLTQAAGISIEMHRYLLARCWRQHSREMIKHLPPFLYKGTGHTAPLSPLDSLDSPNRAQRRQRRIRSTNLTLRAQKSFCNRHSRQAGDTEAVFLDPGSRVQSLEACVTQKLLLFASAVQLKRGDKSKYCQ